MGKFEKLCNEYRENKRLIEELTAMNDELKPPFLKLWRGGKPSQRAQARPQTKPLFHPGLIPPGSKRNTRTCSECSAGKPVTSVSL